MNNTNLLNYFSDTIDNIVLNKNYIYVLLLEEQRYYIGRTGNIFKRLEQHFTKKGAIYTKQYKPIKILEIINENTNDDERIKTIEYMNIYGWEKVRGSYWCSINISKPLFLKKNEKKLIKSTLFTKNKNSCIMNVFDNASKPWTNEDSQKLVELYNNQNKNIQELGEIFIRTPGSIAAKLTHLKIVSARQYARGYDEYINSGLYKEVCTFYKTQKKEKVKKTTKKSEEPIIVSNSENLEVKEMKLEIKEMKLEIKELKGLIKNLSSMIEAVYEFEK